MCQEFDEKVDRRLLGMFAGRGVEAADRDAVINQARAEMTDALPSAIDLSWERNAVVSEAVSALHRYGEHRAQNPESALLEVAFWTKSDRLVSQLPLWLGLAVRERVLHERALPLVIAAVERVTLALGREWVFTKELVEAEHRALAEVALLLGYDKAPAPKSVGHLLRRFAVPTGTKALGLRQSIRRGSAGQRWSVCRPV